MKLSALSRIMAVATLDVLAACSDSALSPDVEIIRTPPTIDYHPALVVSLGDDDSIDDLLRHPATIRNGDSGGFFSRFYPLLMSIGGVPASEAVECWRCGIDSGELNETGITLRTLCNNAGWEAVSHTVTARFYGAYVYDTFEDAMLAISKGRLELESYGESSNLTTHIYIRSEKKNYWYTKNGEWREVEDRYIRPKLMRSWKNYIAENPTFPIEYQVRDSKLMIEEMLGTEVKTFIPPADSRNYHIWSYASTVYPYLVGSMNASNLEEHPNQMPLASIAIRWGKSTFDDSDGPNKADDSLFKRWKNDFLRLKESGTYAIILGTHMYLDCWKNVIDSQLQSNGGSYPDSYVVPVRRPKDMPGSFLQPDPSTGLEDWGEWKMDENGKITGFGWYPCPGTRLYQYWKFLLWIKSQGIEIMTIKDNLDRIANKSSRGMWIPSSFLDPYDDYLDEDFVFVGADGSTVRKKN